MTGKEKEITGEKRRKFTCKGKELTREERELTGKGERVDR